MSDKIEIIDAANGSDTWSMLLESLPSQYRDVFLSPGYAKVYEKIYHGKSSLFYLKTGDSLAFHVFIRRPLHELPFAKTSDSFDIITPEYSGPVIVTDQSSKEEFLKTFWEEFNRYCVKEHIVTEFGRLNPFYNIENGMLEMSQATLNRAIVSIDLKQDDASIMHAFSKGNRGSIKKAVREGVTMQRYFSAEKLSDFHRLYSATMQRNLAKDFYQFSLDFFNDLFAELSGSISLCTATYKDAIIASSIFLHRKNYVHYYFSGSDQDHLSLCPNNLILYEQIRWAQENGYTIFNLGGGYHDSGNDSLYAFKSSFSDRKTPFYVYRRIHDEQRYLQLCYQYCEHNHLNEETTLKEEGYFPLYRT